MTDKKTSDRPTDLPGRHTDRHRKDLIFDSRAKRKKNLLSLNFLSGFLYCPSFAAFASRTILFVKKYTNKSCTANGKLAKEVSHILQAKTSTKKLCLSTWNLWTAFYLTSLITFPTIIFAKTARDTNDISVNITNYTFSYNTRFKNGSYAIGPTVTLNTNGKITLQFGLLYDFKKYIFYEKRIDYSNGNIYYAPVEHINLFIPVSLQYNYFTANKIYLYLTAGCMIGGQNTLNENNTAMKTSNLNLTGGTGMSYHPLKWLTLRIYTTIRYNTGYFFPGVSADLSFLFNSKKLSS